MFQKTQVTVIGAGPAGSECAWQLAKRGIGVKLIDMKPQKMTPAHKSRYFSELVCSNSLRSDELSNAVGLLKAEMRAMDSLFLESADLNRVPAGGALAVDREGFARTITERLSACDNIEIVSEEVSELPEGEVVVATGPLSSDAIADEDAALAYQLPPRSTRSVPEVPPSGSVPYVNVPYQSRHRSHTFPCIS